MNASFDTIILGGGIDSLVAAIVLVRKGNKVLLLEEGIDVFGVHREVEFASGYRAAPLTPPTNFIAPAVLKAVQLQSFADCAVPVGATGVLMPERTSMQLSADVAATCAALRPLSAQDAVRWPAFVAQLRGMRAVLAHVYGQPAPQIDTQRLSDMLKLARSAWQVRALGRQGMREFLRTIPMSAADWFDDWFENETLKGVLAALAVSDLAHGPMAGGTAFNFLHGQCVTPGSFCVERAYDAHGLRQFITMLAQQARSMGVVIKTSLKFGNIIVRNDRVHGFALASGEEFASRNVLSSCDLQRTLFELLDPKHLGPEFMQTVRNVRYRGVTTKVLLALDALPMPAAAVGSWWVAPNTRYVERAYDAIKYSECSQAPVVRLEIPSLTNPALAPQGQHVGVLHIQYTPYGVNDNVVERAVKMLDTYLPGFSQKIRAQVILTPQMLEQQFGLRQGCVARGEMQLDQILFMRPVPQASGYAMPVEGLYMCGPATHPGVGGNGLSGLLAVSEMR
jgi:phytoene dehydrogenase-like protein